MPMLGVPNSSSGQFKASEDMCLNSSNYIALAAVFVSVCAFILTICESAKNRRHQKLSIKPALEIDIQSYLELQTHQ